MNSAQVLTHPAFDRPPVLNARRHGPTPRGIPMLKRERFERRYAQQNAQHEAQRPRTSGYQEWMLRRVIASVRQAAELADELGDMEHVQSLTRFIRMTAEIADEISGED